MQIRLPIALHHILDGGLSGQDVRQASAAFQTKSVGHGRVTQISIDKQHLGTVLGEGGSHVHGNGGLTFGRFDGGDDDHTRVGAFNR